MKACPIKKEIEKNIAKRNAALKRWANPAFRKKRSEQMIDFYANSKHREQTSNAMKKYWANPEARSRGRDSSKKRWENTEEREQARDLAKKLWKDPEYIAKRNEGKKNHPTPKGEKHHLFKHGKADTPIYIVWVGIRRRCSLPNSAGYKIYGGRGIKVCDRWQGKHGFENFWEDMGERPTDCVIHRKDGNGNYTPENCEWMNLHEHASFHAKKTNSKWMRL
jgi:hypothetical protein